MASYELGFGYIMRHEDPLLSGIIKQEPEGAIARFGINSLAHPEAKAAGFYEMPRIQALEYASHVYREHYWQIIRAYAIANQNIANKFFDLAVNSGVVEATKIVQRAVNAMVGQLNLGIQVDGKVGLETLDAINQSSAGDLMVKIREYGKDFYDAVLRSKPEDKMYYDGWIARLES